MIGRLRRQRPTAVPAPERTLRDWVALSLLTRHPRPTGEPLLDEWNQAIACVQSYLNGRAIGARTDDEREYLLRLRADLNFLHVEAKSGTPDAAPSSPDGGE